MTFFAKRWFWVGLAIFSTICLLYVSRNFYHSFPFVELDVRMDRVAAIERARELGRQHAWQPASPQDGQVDVREAASFDVDSATQNFVELEAGGPEALRKVIQDGIYSPYTWQVRRFAEGMVGETRVRFSPDGALQGFVEKLPEDLPGAALKPAAARVIAEREAPGWQVDLKPYQLIETQTEERRGKRVDHVFVYERAEPRVVRPGGGVADEGRYRIRLGVSGSRLTEVTRLIKVPDAFARRYATMRSANGTVATVASAAVVLLYGLGFCAIGLLLLARQGLVQWRAPLALAGVISVLQFADQVNHLPLEWMSYDTAIAAPAFVLRQLAGALLSALFDFGVVAIPLVAGEALSRQAFGGQPQLYRVFAREAGATRQITGRVAGAYLFVAFHFAWVVWVYRFGAERLGWWNPSELLFHPDALEAYFPWLTPIASSLHAGVWEECLFRAVPLGGAALLGRRYGRERTWIVAAFVLQAVIFGAAHASYPTQPAYARLLELLVPSAIFGGVFLGFGLLPAILMHYLYDVVLFAMPVFLASGTTAMVSRVVVVGVSLAPLGWVAWSGLRAGKLRELPSRLLGRAWVPVRAARAAVARSGAAVVLKPLGRRVLLLCGVLALGVWVATVRTDTDVPGLAIDKARAVDAARTELARQGVTLGPEWRALPTVDASPGEPDAFVWREAGPKRYRALVGAYLDPPRWRVRFVRPEAELIERAEEWQLYVGNDGKVPRLRHDLPESRSGKQLEEEHARVIAIQGVRSRFAVEQLVEVSSNRFQLPSRRDWVFVWRDPSVMLPAGGEARVIARVSGDVFTGYRRYIEVPEAWTRAERGRKTLHGVARMLGGAALALLVMAIALGAFRGWVRGQMDRRAFAWALGVLMAMALALRVNEVPVMLAQFTTAQPWESQVFRSVLMSVLMALVASAAIAVCLGRVYAGRASTSSRAAGHAWALGLAAGAGLAALGTLAARGALLLAAPEAPTWPGVAASATVWPWVEALQGVGVWVMSSSVLMLMSVGLEDIAAGGSLRRARGVRWGLFATIGVALAALDPGGSLAQIVIAVVASGVSLGLGHELVRRTSVAVWPVMLATGGVLRALQGMAAQAYPEAVSVGVASALALVAGACVIYGTMVGRRSGGAPQQR